MRVVTRLRPAPLLLANGSSPDGLTQFGRDLVRECERLGIIIDLAHVNSAGFDEILAITSRPLIISHTNARKFYDIDRNASDEQIRALGQRGGIVGVNSILVSPRKDEATIDRFVDHIDHVIELIGIDGVAIGFDFLEFIYRGWTEEGQTEFHQEISPRSFHPRSNEPRARAQPCPQTLERGFNDEQMEKILFRECHAHFQNSYSSRAQTRDPAALPKLSHRNPSMVARDDGVERPDYTIGSVENFLPSTSWLGARNHCSSMLA